MLKLLALLTLTFVAQNARAEQAIASPIPSPAVDCSNTQQVTLFRCVCRINVVTVDGKGQVSIPLYNNGSSTIFSASDLSGTNCEGTLPADACRPGLSGRAQGRYSCAEGSTTEAGGFEIKW